MNQHIAAVDSRRRVGISLVEVIVVVVVLVVLGSLAVAAIQNARENARRSTCRNNLKQIGLGLHNYADTFNGMLPPGIVANYAGEDVSVTGPTADHVGSVGWSWRTMLIPYVEPLPGYPGLNFDLSVGEVTRGSEGSIAHQNDLFAISMFYTRCPSDDRPPYAVLDYSSGDPPFFVTNEPGGIAATSYYGNAGSFEEVVTHPAVRVVPADQVHLAPVYNGGWSNERMTNGIFAVNSSVTMSDIGDGTSQTIAVGEVSGRRDPYAATRSAFYGSIGPNGTLTSDVALSAMRSGEWKINGQTSAARERGFSSEHAGGANFVFMDGAVRFVSEDIGLISAPGLSADNPRREAGCDWAPVPEK